MADETKKVLVDVIVNAADTVKEIANIRKESNELRKEQKALDQSTEEGRIRYEQLALQIQANNKAIRERQAAIQKTQQLQDAEINSLDQLKLEINLATRAYDAMSEAQRVGPQGKALQKFIDDTTKKFKEEKKAIGDTRLEVGNYEDAFTRALQAQGLSAAAFDETNKNLAQMQKDLSALNKVDFTGLSDEEIERVKQGIADLKAGIADFQDEINAMDQGNMFSNITEGLNVVVASVTVVSGALGALGVESETLEKINASTTQLIATMQALGIITEFLEKQKYRYIVANVAQINNIIRDTVTRKLNTATIASQTVAENASTLAKIKGAAITKLLTAATWLWNTALAANPVLAIVIGVAALVAGIIGLISWMDKSTASALEAAKAYEDYKTTMEGVESTIEFLNNKQKKYTRDAEISAAKEIIALKKKGATDTEIAKVQAKNAEHIRNLETAYSKARITQYKDLVKAAQETVKTHEDLIYSEESDADAITKAKEARDEAMASIVKYTQFIADETYAIQKNEIATQEAAVDARKKAADKSYNYQVKIIENLGKIQQSSLKTEEKYLSDNFKSRQEYAAREFNLSVELQRKRLELDLRYGKITKKQYDEELTLIENQRTQFNNSQIKEQNKYFESIQNSINSLLGQSVNDQIKEIEKEYKKAISDLDNIKMPVLLDQTMDEYQAQLDAYEQLLFDRAETVIQLEKEKDKRIADIRKAGEVKTANEIKEIIDKEYDGDLRKYADNEQEKYKVTIAALKKEIEARKKAGLDTYDQEASLRSAESGLIQSQLNTDLLKTSLSADQRYKLKKDALDKERALYKDNAQRQAEIDAEMLEAYNEMLDAKAAAFENWTSNTMGLLNGLNELANALSESEIQKYQEEHDKKKEVLDKQLKDGVISQKKYDQESLKLDQDLAKKQAEIERKNAIRDRALRLFQVGIDTATSIVASSKMGFPAAIPFVAMAAALGAVQTAAILATPLPKAARGKYITGPSHAAGGTAIEAEGGETIINKRSSAMFLPLLSAINQAGGGVPFTTPLSDGGFAVRAVQSGYKLSFEEMQLAMENAVSKVKVVTTIEDIRKGDLNYSEIEDRATF